MTSSPQRRRERREKRRQNQAMPDPPNSSLVFSALPLRSLRLCGESPLSEVL